nr:hypothetical protein CFP56_14974 [Quercus suber]
MEELEAHNTEELLRFDHGPYQEGRRLTSLPSMAEELEELWKKLTFTEEEDMGIQLDSRSTSASVSEMLPE